MQNDIAAGMVVANLRCESNNFTSGDPVANTRALVDNMAKHNANPLVHLVPYSKHPYICELEHITTPDRARVGNWLLHWATLHVKNSIKPVADDSPIASKKVTILDNSMYSSSSAGMDPLQSQGTGI